MTWFAPAPPRILAHRGLALDGVLQNSLEAFRAALDAGADHLETDARATRDGHAVLWHDASLEAFDGTGDEVALRSLAELRSRAKGPRAIATLAEALAALPEARFNVDVKSEGAIAPVARAVREARADERVLVCSFSESRLAGIRRALPACASSASAPRLAAALAALEAGCDGLARRALGGADAVQVPERAAGLTLVAARRLAAFKRVVREVHVWTVNDPQRMRELWLAGVDGIVTDRPDLAARVRAELGAAPSKL